MQTQAIDDPALDDDVTAHRERAKDLLNEIARQTKQALTEQGMDTSVFFLIPHTGDAIITFGTTLDPTMTSGAESARSSQASCGSWSGWIARDAERWCARPLPIVPTVCC